MNTWLGPAWQPLTLYIWCIRSSTQGWHLPILDHQAPYLGSQAISHTCEVHLQVQKVSTRVVSRAPPAPFTTSTLQQAASSQLSMDPSYTMQLAQQLYEGPEDGVPRLPLSLLLGLPEMMCSAPPPYLIFKPTMAT